MKCRKLTKEEYTQLVEYLSSEEWEYNPFNDIDEDMIKEWVDEVDIKVFDSIQNNEDEIQKIIVLLPYNCVPEIFMYKKDSEKIERYGKRPDYNN